MKKSLFLIPMALLILTGCTDESSDSINTQETDVQPKVVAKDVQETEKSTNELTIEEKSPTTELFPYSEAEKFLDSQVTAPKTWLY